ncbi:nucleophosmin-like [Setaria italica]|uniref:nucleophosmin-like n=1 Tax=Setaria italica TaxID=4555 RepID=UPI000BE52D58|nr:nucleophosmin-like [Setaria italica]
MLRVRSLADMTPSTPTEGIILATGALAAFEIRQRIREALEDKDADYPVPGHPPMRPDEKFIDLGSMTWVMDLRPSVLEDAERRLQNRLLAKKQKRRKDKETTKKKKGAAKEFQRRQRGQVVSDDDDDDDDDDEEEEEEDDEEEEELVQSPWSGALVIRETRSQTAARDEAGGPSARGLVLQSSGSMPQGSARSAPQESARSAFQGSTEPAPAPVPAAQEKRSGGKRPLPDALESASSSEAKRARRPCTGGT